MKLSTISAETTTDLCAVLRFMVLKMADHSPQAFKDLRNPAHKHTTQRKHRDTNSHTLTYYASVPSMSSLKDIL